MKRIRSLVIGLTTLDTRALELSISAFNFVWGWWLLLVTQELANSQGILVLDSLGKIGGQTLWGVVFMLLFAIGFVFAYRSVAYHELIYWNIRFYTLLITSILWLAFSLFFVFVGGLFSIPAFLFFGVGVVALFGSNLIKWDYVRR